MILSSKTSVIKQTFSHETLALAFTELLSLLGRSTGATVSETDGINVVFNLRKAEGYLVEVNQQQLIFNAGSEVEILYAVYTFAEEILGFCFFEPGNDRWCSKDTIELNDGEIISRRLPLLKNRGFIQEFPFDDQSFQIADWMAKNRLNYLLVWMTHYDQATEEIKKQYRIRGITIESGHHSFNYWIPPEKYHEKHPEYFAINNGKRVFPSTDISEFLRGGQLCTANGDLRSEIVRNMVEYCRIHPELRTITLIPNDGFGWCECDECSVFYDKSHKGELYSMSEHVCQAQNIYHDLVADIATRISKELPDIKLTFAAYVNYIEPARGFTLKDNLAVHFAPYWRCLNHKINDTHCPINSRYMKTLEKWRAAKEGGDINIYEYYMGINLYVSLPVIHHEDIFDEIRFYSEKGIDGVLTQFHVSHWTAYGLNYYMMAKAMYGDTKDTIPKTMRAIFGNDADNAQAFYVAMKKLIQNAGPCHIPYPRSLLRRTKLEDYETIHALADKLASNAPTDDRFRKSLYIWAEYLIRFKRIYDDYSNEKNVAEDINEFLNWIKKHSQDNVFVINRVERLLAKWLERIEIGQPWYHYNFDWEDEHIKKHDTLLNTKW